MHHSPPTRVLVLWADDVSTNLGVRALAQGTAALARRTWPGCEVVFHNFGTPGSRVPSGRLRSIVRERVSGSRGTMEWMSGFDIAIDTRSGDSFTDIYGQRRLRIMSGVAELAAQAGVPVVLGPQTIGPFDTRRGRMIARFSLGRARAVFARDTESAAYAKTLRHPVDLLTTDVVFALPVPEVAKSRDVVLNVSGLLWHEGPHVDAAAYRQTLQSLYRRLVADSRRVSLLAHVIDSPLKDNDVPAIEEFARLHGFDGEIIRPQSLDDVRTAVASASLVIGSRMHACLNALSVGTPAIPLAYSRKFAPLLGDLGWRHSIDLRSDTDAAAAAMRAVNSPDLAANVGAVTERAAELLGPAPDVLRSIR